MMLHGNLGKAILVAIICAAVLYLIIPFDFMLKGESRSLAFIPHENPEPTEQAFSDIPSFMFDSDYLNLVLQMDPEKAKSVLKKRAFSRVAQKLKEAIDQFNASTVYISNLIIEIDEDLAKLMILVGQNRFDEATHLADEIHAKLSETNRELKRIEEAMKTVDARFKISSFPPGSNFRRFYDELLEKIDGGREKLDLDNDIMADFSMILAEKLVNPTEITLKIEPTAAFVGDDIYITGMLNSEEEQLARRRINILLDGFRYATTRTYSHGYYSVMLRAPHRYTSELRLQAVYWPTGEDIGLHNASLSPVRKLKVLFHESKLEIVVEDRVYPGLETVVTGRFDYGQSPPLKERNVEIYLDDVLITEFVAQEAFAQEIKIDPEADVGKHVITVSSAPVGRYSPVVASVMLNVTSPSVTVVNPILDINIPKVAMIPGSIGLGGKLYSEVGPLSGASIKMGLGKSQVELVSSEDGTFDTKIKVGMGFGVIGSEDLVVEVIPREPWHAPLNTTGSVLMVNVVNCGALVAILLFLEIYLPRRLRRWGAYPRRRARPAVVAQPQLAPRYDQRATVLTSSEEGDEGSGEPRDRIFHWYRLVVRLIQGITKVLLKPQQTLQEFAKESSKVLGFTAKYFIELTKLVERLLYSQYKPTEKDVENSKQLSRKTEEETKLRVTTQPLLAQQLREEGALRTRQWGQLSTWLWVLLLLAVAYYACILLFLLPLLYVSTAP